MTVARSRFLTRNRVIAAIARAVVVVRAQARSGSLSTAAAAKALGRPLGAVVGPLGDALSEGCHHLLDEGAVPICSRSGLGRWLGQVVGREVGWSGRPWPTRPVGLPAPWDLMGVGGRDGPAGARGEIGDELPATATEAQMAKVMAMIAAEPGLDLDTIAVRSAVPFENLIGCLLDLELRGGIERLPGGRYRTTGRGV
ncbi:MAG TPA: DNA-processing protein DprA [Myxococcota bacterium]|nr:DNA-processing protein DprA [Myxococcota bacterium]